MPSPNLFNLPFLTMSGVVLLFTAGKGVPAILYAPLQPLSLVHITSSCLMSWGCIISLLATPPALSRGARRVHKFVGYFTHVNGLVSALTGFAVVAKTGQFNALGVGISIGGVLQLRGQYFSLKRITRVPIDVDKHQRSGTFVFFLGCGIPTLMRGLDIFFPPNQVPDAAYLLCAPLAYVLARASLRCKDRGSFFY